MSEKRYAVYTIHPDTGRPAWFKAPGEGWSYNREEACLWFAEELAHHIQASVNAGGDWGTKHAPYPCRIRAIPVGPRAEREEGDCPHCEGTGDEHQRPYYECAHCCGTGSVSLAEDA